MANLVPDHIAVHGSQPSNTSPVYPFTPSLTSRPQNVGIRKLAHPKIHPNGCWSLRKIRADALEVYFPSRCVDEKELETFDGASTGKVSQSALHKWIGDNLLNNSIPLDWGKSIWPLPMIEKIFIVSSWPVSICSFMELPIYNIKQYSNGPALEEIQHRSPYNRSSRRWYRIRHR